MWRIRLFPCAYQGRVYLLRHRGDVVCPQPRDGTTLWTGAFPRDRSSYFPRGDANESSTLPVKWGWSTWRAADPAFRTGLRMRDWGGAGQRVGSAADGLPKERRRRPRLTSTGCRNSNAGGSAAYPSWNTRNSTPRGSDPGTLRPSSTGRSLD